MILFCLIPGNKTFEKLASMSLIANLVVYFHTQYNIDIIVPTDVFNIWSGFTNFLPLAGGYVADAFLGKFSVLVVGSIASFLGMGAMTLNCRCLRPCRFAFGADQFDSRTDTGRAQPEKFCNWWYLLFTASLLVALTAVVYVQTHVGWLIGEALEQSFYDPPIDGPEPRMAKLAHTNRFIWLDKADIIPNPSELDKEGKPTNRRRLCSVQQVEQLKGIVGTLPVWLSAIGCFLAMTQMNSLGILQAIQINKSIGPNFQVPPAWMGLTPMIALSTWIYTYECIYVPWAKKTGKKDLRLSMEHFAPRRYTRGEDNQETQNQDQDSQSSTVGSNDSAVINTTLAPPRPSKSMVIGTIFGHRRRHVWFCIQHDRLSTKPILLLELSICTHQLVQEMRCGLVRIALECNRSELESCPLHSVPVWTMYCNGRKLGFAEKRKASERVRFILKMIQSTTVGAGAIPSVFGSPSSSELMYMRANYEHVVGSADSESFHLINADECPGQDLIVFLLRSRNGISQ
ncbi:protein MIZU-KUSSEI 1-like [Quillaja saponaria]|uniref:Protein MIZU-KUSSEI 1-like n=1 Tax=Quillaja saponaria TaxID=32244 RepID=A0AAD7PCV0_QUISA|nr:protein MIZU-KUSSEI 1-like [Quillaja saponaria]